MSGFRTGLSENQTPPLRNQVIGAGGPALARSLRSGFRRVSGWLRVGVVATGLTRQAPARWAGRRLRTPVDVGRAVHVVTKKAGRHEGTRTGNREQEGGEPGVRTHRDGDGPWGRRRRPRALVCPRRQATPSAINEAQTGVTGAGANAEVALIPGTVQSACRPSPPRAPAGPITRCALPGARVTCPAPFARPHRHPYIPCSGPAPPRGRPRDRHAQRRLQHHEPAGPPAVG